MITFVDTNILLDVLLPDPKFGKSSLVSLEKSFEQGSLVINEIIYGELAPQFKTREFLDDVLSRMGIRVIQMDLYSAYNAGKSWQKYRETGGRRNRIITDFFIAAHAQSSADVLLTRDRGFYRKYFKNLKLSK